METTYIKMWRWGENDFRIHLPTGQVPNYPVPTMFQSLSIEQLDELGYNVAFKIKENSWYEYDLEWEKEGLEYRQIHTTPPILKEDVCCCCKEEQLNERRKALVYGKIIVDGFPVGLEAEDRMWLNSEVIKMTANPSRVITFKYRDESGKIQFMTVDKTMIETANEQVDIFSELCFDVQSQKQAAVRLLSGQDLVDYDVDAGWPSTTITTE